MRDFVACSTFCTFITKKCRLEIFCSLVEKEKVCFSEMDPLWFKWCSLVAGFERYGYFYITVSVYRAVDCRSTCVWILNSRSMELDGGRDVCSHYKYVFNSVFFI